MTQELIDRRALAFPDEPYSAYCKVCWNSVYIFWADKRDHHGGACPDGHTVAANCPEAGRRERNKAKLAKMLEATNDA